MSYFKNHLTAWIPIALVFFLLVACAESGKSVGEEVVSGAVIMDVYKRPSCKCCGKWIQHAKSAGFDVTTKNRASLKAVKKAAGIKPHHQSCHTGVAEGYVFEGHIPAAIIQKFLEEKPISAIGLAVPGMPAGSPGMEMGTRFEPYDVLLLKRDGSSELYAHVAGPDSVTWPASKKVSNSDE